jgi:hypothetical protein
MAADKLRIWGGYKHDSDGKRTGKATAKEIKAAGKGGLTANERDRKTARGLAKAEAQPYYTASDEVQTQIDRSMTNSEIDKIYGTGYTIAGGSAAGYAPALAASSGNIGSLISGVANNLPGGTTDYGVTSMVAGATDEAKSNALLAGFFSKSAGIDVGTAAAKGIFGAKGRRDAQDADLRKEQRGYRMQGDTISNDYLKQLNNLLGIRATRENLALAKLQTEAQRLANAGAGRGGGGSGGGSGRSGGGGGQQEQDPMSNVDAATISKYDPSGGAGTGYGTSAGANAGSRGGFVGGSTSTSQPASTTTPTTPTTQTPTTTTPPNSRPDIYNVPGGQQGAGTPGGRDLWIPPYDRGLGIIVPGHFGTKQEYDEYKLYKRK